VDCPPDPEPPKIDPPDFSEPEPEPEEASFLFEVSPDVSEFTGDAEVNETVTKDFTITATQGSGTVAITNIRFAEFETNTIDGIPQDQGTQRYDLSEGQSVTVTLGVSKSRSGKALPTWKFYEPFGTDITKQFSVSAVVSFHEKEEVGDPTFSIVSPSSIDKGSTLQFNVDTSNYSGTIYWETDNLNVADINGTKVSGSQEVTSNGTWAESEKITPLSSIKSKYLPTTFIIRIRSEPDGPIRDGKAVTINDTGKNDNPVGNTSEPVEFPIGWYGAVLGRESDSRYTGTEMTGSDHWIRKASQTSLSVSELAERFLSDAENNYENGEEDIYNDNALDSSNVSKKDVITGTASYDPDTGKTTITGKRLDGSTINKTIDGTVSQTDVNFK